MKLKEELRIISISLLVAVSLTVLPAIFFMIIGQPLIYALLVFIITLLVRYEIIKLEAKNEWKNGSEKELKA